MTTPDAHRNGGRTRYRVHPAASAIPIPLSIAGLYAVHAPADRETRVYYCEPASGRCSCGAPSGSCAHIAAAISLSEVPRRRRRGE